MPILKVSAEYDPKFFAASKRLGDEAFQTLIGHGMEMLPISDQMKTEMRAKTKPIVDKYLEETPEARPIYEAYIKELGSM